MQSGSPQANKCIILASLYKEFSIYCTTDHGVKKENCISPAKFTTPLSSFPKYVQSIYVRTCRCSPYSLLHFLCLHDFFHPDVFDTLYTWIVCIDLHSGDTELKTALVTLIYCNLL